MLGKTARGLVGHAEAYHDRGQRTMYPGIRAWGASALLTQRVPNVTMPSILSPRSLRRLNSGPDEDFVEKAKTMIRK
jgi:hypothetical protein